MKTLILTLFLTASIVAMGQRHFRPGSYRGGVEMLYAHLGLKLTFTEEAADLKKSGVAYSAILVDEKGDIDSAWIVQEFDPTTTENILKTLNSMSGFEPSTHHGKAVPAVYLFSILYDNKSFPKENLAPDVSVYDGVKEEHKFTSELQPMSLTAATSMPQFGVRKKE